MADCAYQRAFDFDHVTFSPMLAEQAKKDGMAKAALSRKELLEKARLYAVTLAKVKGGVTSDDVFSAMLADGLNPVELGPAAGCVFRDPQFEFSGEWKKSQRVSNHGSDLRVWRLRQGVAARKPVQRAQVPDSTEQMA